MPVCRSNSTVCALINCIRYPRASCEPPNKSTLFATASFCNCNVRNCFCCSSLRIAALAPGLYDCSIICNTVNISFVTAIDSLAAAMLPENADPAAYPAFWIAYWYLSICWVAKSNSFFCCANLATASSKLSSCASNVAFNSFCASRKSNTVWRAFSASAA